MGSSFSQTFTNIVRMPVSVNEWESLQREAIRIRMDLLSLVQDIEKWPLFHSEYEQRYFTIKKQWQVVYSMLIQMIKTNRVGDLHDSLEWCKQIRRETDRLAERYIELRKAKLTTIDEKEEPFLADDKSDFVL